MKTWPNFWSSTLLLHKERKKKIHFFSSWLTTVINIFFSSLFNLEKSNELA